MYRLHLIDGPLLLCSYLFITPTPTRFLTVFAYSLKTNSPHSSISSRDATMAPTNLTNSSPITGFTQWNKEKKILKELFYINSDTWFYYTSKKIHNFFSLKMIHFHKLNQSPAQLVMQYTPIPSRVWQLFLWTKSFPDMHNTHYWIPSAQP